MLNDKNNEAESLRNENQELRIENVELKKQITDELIPLKQQASHISSKNVKLSKKKHDLLDSNQALKSQIDIQRTELQNRILSLETQNRDLTEKLSKTEADMNHKISEYESKIASEKQLVKQANEQKNRFQFVIEKLNELFNVQSKDLLVDAATNAITQLKMLNEKLSNLETKIKSSKSDFFISQNLDQ